MNWIPITPKTGHTYIRFVFGIGFSKHNTIQLEEAILSLEVMVAMEEVEATDWRSLYININWLIHDDKSERHEHRDVKSIFFSISTSFSIVVEVCVSHICCFPMIALCSATTRRESTQLFIISIHL